jgi:hypothetical protein
MNRCRTCKYWAVYPSAIGVGNCLNLDTAFALMGLQPVRTTQNFGCIFHTEGTCQAEIISRDDQDILIKEFIAARK